MNGFYRNSLFKDKSFLKLAKAKIDELIADGLYEKLAQDIDEIAASIENTRNLNYQNGLSTREAWHRRSLHHA